MTSFDSSKNGKSVCSVEKSRKRGYFSWLLVVCLIALAVNARVAVSSLGPVLAEAQQSLHMNGFVTGVVTALPGFVFGVVGMITPSVSARMGLHATLVFSMTAIAAGILLRTFTSNAFVFIGWTVLALCGIAASNVLAPAFIRAHFPNRITQITGVYSTFIALSTMVAALVSAPLAMVAPGGWRAAVGMWGLLALGSVLPLGWLWAHRLRSRSFGSARESAHVGRSVSGRLSLWGMFRSRKAVFIMVFFGVQSMNAYVQFGWLPQMFRDQGLNPQTAGSLLAFLQLVSLPGGFIAPFLAARLRHPRILPVVFGLLLVFGYGGIYLAPLTFPFLWVTLLAVSGWCFMVALYLIGTQARVPERTAQLSGFAQGFGYIIAGIGPIVIGVLKSATGSWELPLILLILSAPVLLFSGWMSFSEGYVD